MVGGDRAEEETDEEDENRRSMAAAHHRPQSGLCYQVAQLVLVKMYLRYILGPTKIKLCQSMQDHMVIPADYVEDHIL